MWPPGRVALGGRQGYKEPTAPPLYRCQTLFGMSMVLFHRGISFKPRASSEKQADAFVFLSLH